MQAALELLVLPRSIVPVGGGQQRQGLVSMQTIAFQPPGFAAATSEGQPATGEPRKVWHGGASLALT